MLCASFTEGKNSICARILVNLRIGLIRITPTFGVDKIRRMRRNVPQFQKFAARDYEDLLQVGIFSRLSKFDLMINGQ
jgi:hypothetical protein